MYLKKQPHGCFFCYAVYSKFKVLTNYEITLRL